LVKLKKRRRKRKRKKKDKTKTNKNDKRPLTLESVEGGHHLFRVGDPPHSSATRATPRVGFSHMERVGEHAKTPVGGPDEEPITIAILQKKEEQHRF